jgi:membrane peptidoglycan carboxypeptidase
MRHKRRMPSKSVLSILLFVSVAVIFTASAFGCACSSTFGNSFDFFPYAIDPAAAESIDISLEEISPYLLDAVVAVEDRRFYEHKGLDYGRIISALVSNLREGKIVEGGSTISQQYIKNAYLGPERTYARKLREAYLTIQLERQYPKEKILLMYLDSIYFGAGVYGIVDASRMYYGIEPSALDLSQSALLAGIIRSPENYSPLNNPNLSLTRRNLVLALMYEQKYIDKEQYIEALNAPLDPKF